MTSERAMNIIFPDMDYKLSLIMARIDTLEERREVLTKRFLPRDAMRKRGLCCRPVSVRLSVRHVGILYPEG